MRKLAAAERGRACSPGSFTTRAGLAATLMAVVLTSCALGLSAGCTSSTPLRTVGEFIAARIAGNEEKAATLTVEGDLSGYMGGEPFLYANDVTFELEQERVEGDRAVVVAHFSWGDQSADIPYVTRRIGTKWRVALRETQELWLPDLEMTAEPAAP